MGKLANFIVILVFLDLLFIVTGQIGINSPSSIIFQALISPGDIQASTMWILIIGAIGVAGLAGSAGAISGIVTTPLEIAALTVTAIFLAGIAGDFISIYNILRVHNEILALIFMSPIIVLFAFTIVEWLLKKD